MMGDNTRIEWTDATWNPLVAFANGKRGWFCTKPSPGCKNCYAEAINLRLGNGLRYSVENLPAIQWAALNLDQPTRWRRSRMIFVNSMTDLFHEAVPDEIIGRIWGAMLSAPHHRFQVLTKRAERMRALVTRFAEEGERKGFRNPDHIWLGVSVEDRKFGLPRIKHLRETPAKVRMLSCEPLLEDLGEVNLRGIGWVIVGGESGPRARPMHPDWARNLRDRCQKAGVAFHFKQWGEWEPYERGPVPMHVDTKGAYHDGHGLNILDAETGDTGKGWMLGDEYDVAFRKVGKRAAGRLLDGRTWDELPEAQWA